MATLPPSFLGTQPKYDPIADKAKFEKELNDVFSKALQINEAPIKEKHVRSATISTWREKNCSTFWKCVRSHPLERQGVVCYKSCYMIHKMLRDGYPDNAKRSATHAKFVSELARHWNQLGDPVSKMITSYLKVIWNKIALHVKNPDIPCTLNFTEKPFVVPSDIDYVFQLTVEVFDYQSAILHFYAGVNATLSEPITQVQLQYRIAPFVPCIKESAALYDLVVKLMKALHTSLPAETLNGHRERFNRQYSALRKYFAEAAKRDYIKKFVDVPVLPPDPPNFLIGSFDELHLSNTVFSHEGGQPMIEAEYSLASTAITPESSIDPRSRLNTLDGTLIDLGTPITAPETDSSRFDSVFGQQEFTPFVNEVPPSVPPPTITDERDLLIEQLMREIVELKDRIRELEEQNLANLELLGAARTQMEEKNKELSEYKEVAEQACTENVRLKEMIDAEKSMGATQVESDERTKAVEQKFTQLKDIYQKLRNEHVQLLRTNGDAQKKLRETETKLLKEEANSVELQGRVESLNTRIEVLRSKTSDETSKITLLEQSLKAKEIEATKLQESTNSLQQQLEKSAQASSHSLLVAVVRQAESIVNQSLRDMDEFPNDTIACAPDILIKKAGEATTVTINLHSTFAKYLKEPAPAEMESLLALVPEMAHRMVQIIQYGISNGPVDQKVTAKCKEIGSITLNYLREMYSNAPNNMKVKSAAAELQLALKQLLGDIEDLKRERAEAAEEESAQMGDIVDEEMASTSIAVNEAARKIEEILKRSREEQSGVNLEVNSRILDSCTDLMKAIQVLIVRSKELQQEVVAEGPGSNAKEFYKKNHNWSEGLISAAKQVGHGASRLVDCADKVVSGNGKFEALIVNSKDIAACTAQLVAASMVKARARSERLKALKASSRAVSEATGSVVASAQSGADIKAEAANKVDFSKLSLNQTKRYEMESQVRALELEKELEMERTKLAELRKIHYHKAGASEGWDEEEGAN
ncbi:PREDICTED: huntingtin-interacting protein 1-like isoform X2 [Amphimedon queenslandica]|uniref:I/LWEQ domain-containing protein n=1 Tax=Amphimedon queenslandica TaxID=400682 RepID=A0A1X7VJ52_AMPQE|nr:PREDICTED: huntingtin-interacting protein 1-like isoform X2 [Amphimedon queenslandica]|eukprot:XP_019848785.1 PREDICTED: huntingtin-interacting protein 1-like isoform X2 [Amphimedon queenslandica]